MTIIATQQIYGPSEILQRMINNIGLTLSVGDTIVRFTTTIEQDN